MRRVIMWNVVTLDGYFEGPTKWDLEFHNYVWGDEMERFSLDQLAAADTLLFGRVTYEGMASYWSTATGDVADAMNGLAKVVYSSTLDDAAWINTTLVREPAEQHVARLKQEPGSDILIFGSAEVCSALSRARLIDEYRLAVAPVVLGAGNPLFKPSPEPLRLDLAGVQPLQTGGVILRYVQAEAR